MRLLLPTCSLLLIFISGVAFGQPQGIDAPDLEFHQINKGLSQNRINCIAQDRYGYIWAGTDAGLNRYDGIRFEVFLPSSTPGAGLPDGRISDLLLDKNGRLWVALYGGGLSYYDEAQNQFVNFQADEEDSQALPDNAIHCLHEDSKGSLWVGTEKGLVRWKGNGQFERFPKLYSEEGLSNQVILSIEEGADGGIWLGLGNGINLFYPEESRVEKIEAFEGGDPMNAKRLEYVFSDLSKDGNGGVWAATQQHGLLHLEKKEGEAWSMKAYQYRAENPWSLGSNSVQALMLDEDNRLWVGTENGGLNLYLPEKDGFYKYKENPNKPYTLKGSSVWDIMKDDAGRLWVGTFNQGLNVHDPYYRKFKHEKRYPGGGNQLSNNNVTSFEEMPSGKIWIGTDGGGISIWDREKNSYAFLNHNPNSTNSIGSDAVLALHKDRQGHIWIGSWEGGLNRYNINTNRIERFWHNPDNPNSIGGNRIFDLAEDSLGRIWAAVFQYGLSVYDPKLDKFYGLGFNFSISDKSDQLLTNSLSVALMLDKDGWCWLGSLEGLTKIRLLEDGTFESVKYRYDRKDPTSISSNSINEINQTADGTIWVSTGNGLCRYLPEQDAFETFNVKEGLPTPSCNGLLEGEQGNLWVSTAKGLCKMTPKADGSYSFRVYDTTDGLQADEFGRHSMMKTSQGELFFGGVNGFNYFYPKLVKDNPHEARALLTTLKVFNQPVKIGAEDSPLEKHLSVTDRISLNHKQSVFSIDFIGLNFTHADKNRYAYRLKGLEKDWNYVGGRSTATYTNLDAGEYTFMVKASNNDQVWQSKPTTLGIRIIPPWWETLWFKAVAVALLILSAIYFYKVRTRRLKMQQQILTKKVEERTKELVEKQMEVETQNEELTQQSEEILAQRDALSAKHNQLEHTLAEVNQKNKAITDSIRYAQTIQQSILPSQSYLSEIFEEHLEVYVPKDIVSGDYYWSTEREGVKFMAVVDCTGHGVPGAFMSMIGNTLLNRIVKEQHIFDTVQVMQNLNEGVASSLRQKDSHNSDGMDVSLCSIRKGEEEGTYLVEFCGAKNHLFYIEQSNPKVIQRLKGNRKSVGGWYNKNAKFTSKTITLRKGDLIYLCSDGIIDMQVKGKIKLGSAGFLEHLGSISEQPLEQQERYWYEFVDKCKELYSQRDDIAIVAFRL